MPPMGGLVAREIEFQAIRDLLAGERATRALVLEGEPGVGKTSLWEQGVAWARDRGMRVLVARSSEAETPLPFAGLIDVLDGVSTEELSGVPTPQLRALDVVLYRADPTDRPPEPQVISIAVLSALRALAEAGPVLVAVDDVSGSTGRPRTPWRTPCGGWSANPSRTSWPGARGGARPSRTPSPTSIPYG